MACIVVSLRRMTAIWGTVAASNARRVVRYARARGLTADTHPLAASGCATRVPASQMLDYWSHAARELDAADLPIAIAAGFRLESLDLLGFMLLSAPTVRHALETFAAYASLLTDSRRWVISRDEKSTELRLDASYARVLGARLSHETSFAQVLGGIRQLAGEHVVPLEVSFRHARPRCTRAHHEHFLCPVRFGAPADRLLLANDVLEVVPRGGNAALFRYLRGQADVALRAFAPRPLTLRIREEVATRITEGQVSDVAVVAATLGTSERTLRRVLAGEGLTFRGVVDAARRAREEELLREPGVSITRAALEAGFSDASAFSHACRRWFGRSPREVAARGRG